MKDKIGKATPKRPKQPEKPLGYGEGITINGGNFTGNIIFGNTAPITINLMLPCPAMAVYILGVAATQLSMSIWRIIAPKRLLGLAPNNPQIFRDNLKIPPNPSFRHISRFFTSAHSVPILL